jgi:hypothetical protein
MHAKTQNLRDTPSTALVGLWFCERNKRKEFACPIRRKERNVMKKMYTKR